MQLQSSGPAYLYVSTGQDSPLFDTFSNGALRYPNFADIRYLGTCEFAPRILVNPRYVPIQSSVAGGPDATPHDKFWMGEDALISGTLTDWNELVYEQVAARPVAAVGGVPGKDSGRGRMMVLEGLSYSLWVQFPYATAGGRKAVYGTGGMPAGYRFPAAWLGGPEDMAIGTGANKRSIIFYGAAVYERVQTINGASQVIYNSHFLLYDALTTYLPSAPTSAAVDSVSGALLSLPVGMTGNGGTRPAFQTFADQLVQAPTSGVGGWIR